MSAVSTPAEGLDLGALADKWLQQCGPCDGGLPMGCSHPQEDYRPVMAALLAEVERLREEVKQAAAKAWDEASAAWADVLDSQMWIRVRNGPPNPYRAQGIEGGE